MTTDIDALDREINEMILTGKAMEAFEKHYAEDVVMAENFDAPCVGKAANREREIKFFSSIEQFHGASVESRAVGDGVTFSEWIFDATYKGGFRAALKQVAVRRWKDGKVVHERFYYKPQAG